MDQGEEIVAEEPGRFGVLSVRDDDGVRSLWCDGICHGAAFLEPTVVRGGRRYRPGPVPDAPYQLGWLLPALALERGQVLMAGLGSGSGICVLLHHFPRLHVTVVEIDPAVVRLALTHLPLLGHHVALGRCTVVVAAFADYLSQHPDQHWDAALLDAYADDGELDHPTDLLRALRGRVDACWLNVAGQDGERARTAVERLSVAEWTPRVAAVVRFSDDGFAGNVLIGTATIDVARAAAFVPFADLDHPNADRARADYAVLLAGICVLA